jgi:S-DNA-T family DNA segregation ATPase FtsK/SpoIIIE
LIDMMEKDGIVSAPDGSKPREVLKRPEWIAEVKGSMQ